MKKGITKKARAAAARGKLIAAARESGESNWKQMFARLGGKRGKKK